MSSSSYWIWWDAVLCETTPCSSENRNNHDDVTKWNIFRVKGRRRGALLFSLICALNKRLSIQSLGWWLRRHHAHYGVIIMVCSITDIQTGTKWLPLCIRHYQLRFPVWKLSHFGSNFTKTWWRYQMETFSALLALCTENSPVTGEFPAQRPVTQSFDVFFDLRLE